MSKVIVFGSLNMDLSMVCGRLPRTGETIMGSGFFTNAGGKGGNQAVAASRAGAQTVMLARVGDDAFGDPLVEGLQKAGVDCSYVRKAAGYSTGTAMIIRSDGENRIIVDPGANYALGPTEACKLLEAVAEPEDVLLTQLECDFRATEAVLGKAHELGLYTVLNAAPGRKLPDEILRGLDLLCVNETECEAISGIIPADRWRAKEALRYFAAKGVHNTIVTVGKHGSMGLVEGEFVTVPAFRVASVDTTGAGDAYLGAVAAELSRGNELADGMRIATAAAALAVQKPGAQQSMPTTEQILAFLEQTDESVERNTLADKVRPDAQGSAADW